MKAPDATINTHFKEVKGLFIFIEQGKIDRIPQPVAIYCTSETDWETLSLGCANVQILVSVKDIERVIAEARESRGDKA